MGSSYENDLLYTMYPLPVCSYLKYGGKSVSIMDALSLTLQFVREQGSSDKPSEEMEEGQAEKRARISLRPSPHSVSSGEMDVLEGCLNRWVHELKTEVKGALCVCVCIVQYNTQYCIHV